ncbi:MAG TPA: questin oxidase family protein [Burkholderiaceae bacterium]
MSATVAAAQGAAWHRLLDANLELPPEYADQLTNHLPMALHALAELGADDARMQQFFKRYARRFAGRVAEPAAAAAPDWPALRGQPHAFAPLCGTFAAALAHEGRDAVLRAALPALLPGVAAAAFHGAIRTAHAVQAGHDGELAAALAYWAWRWQPLAAAPRGTPMPFDAWCERLIAAGEACSFDGSLISQRMAGAAHCAAYRELAGSLAPAIDVPDRLLAFAAQCYADTRNFTVLHLVTGLRALRVLLPWVPDGDAALREVVPAFTAAYLSAAVRPAALPPIAVMAWSTIVQRAIASDDDHVIKLVHACHGAAKQELKGPFLAAASRAVA